MSELNSTKVCVDDFGYREEINQAVYDLFDQQKINATSILVDSLYIDDAVITKVKSYKEKGLELGLHINLTEIFPDSEQNTSLYQKISSFTFSFGPNTYQTKELLVEIERQLQKFITLFGFKPDFIDGHQHVHATPVVRPAFVKFIGQLIEKDYQPWIRVTNHDHAAVCAVGFSGELKSRLLNYMGLQLCKQINKHFKNIGKERCLHFYHLLGIYNFSKINYAKNFLGWLKIGQRVIEFHTVIMVHPATYAPANDPISKARSNEYETLMSMDYKLKIL